MIKKNILLVLFLTILVSCQSSSQTAEIFEPTSYPIIESTKNATVLPTFVETIVTPIATPTVEKTIELVLTDTVMDVTETPIVDQNNDTQLEGPGYILIDHLAIDKFDSITDEIIREASSIKVLFRGASVEENIRYGLECMYGNFPGRRPNSCSAFYDQKFDSSNWVFQFRGNPGWIEKVDDFIRETEAQGAAYDVLMFTVGYIDGLDGTTFPEISKDENFQKLYIEKLEALEAKYPDKIFVWWTMSLAQEGQINTTNFNEMLRLYAKENNKILVDLADFESHDPNGVQCLDNNQLPVICKNYTDEKVSGHLNELGRERGAKLFWYMMARLIGWKES